MLPVVICPAARNDQLDIAEYYDAHGGETLGSRFLHQCDAGFERLAHFPESGTVVRYKHPKLAGCRFILVPGFDKILIFYKALPDRIEIVRILHGARNIEEAPPLSTALVETSAGRLALGEAIPCAVAASRSIAARRAR